MALTVGTIAPNFTTTDDTGKTVSLSDFQGKVVVLYFYPKDDTPGCTKQAQSFRDNYEQYQDKEIVVFGVSRDDQGSHAQFKEKYGLPFQLLVDTDGAIVQIVQLAADRHALGQRCHANTALCQGIGNVMAGRGPFDRGVQRQDHF